MKLLIFAKEKINFYEIDPTDPEKMEIHVESSIREFVELKRKYNQET
ncbi:hypothetical protein LEP1GSC125_2323 [Leptospira mayottensis 200901122]|uniref:Uncharacterized protein n=1 Tax=Leptospira mayottensis 200901122 TaxID=1193010 RepID=A0AA87SW96_9LEPT|nr:hypothetical protein LEP1GSC125_2325 [Leptospira mayottensis 200901122]EKR98908.1 hypothetical protein LEP1GSC125_2323 [Leptospira mayottensis 200901122]